MISLLQIWAERELQFVNFHRILNPAAGSPRLGGRILLRLSIDALVPCRPVVITLDDTIKRRWDQRIWA